MGPVTAAGKGAIVEFDGSWVTITRKGFFGRTIVGKGEKRIPVGQISGVQLKPAGPLINGFIQFSAPGGNERRSRFGTQTSEAAKDENSVLFTKDQQPEFETMRDAIQGALINNAHRPVPSAADELTKLAALRDSGVLSDDEFAAQKAKILKG